MALPQAIQRLEDEANAITQQMQTQQTDAEPVVTDASQLTPANEAPVAPQAAPAQPAPTPAPSDDGYEHKFRTLQGKYNAEVPRLTRALQEAEQKMQAFQQQMDELRAKTEAKPVDTEVKPTADPKDIENFGADLVDMVNRQSEKVYNTIAAQLSKRVAEFDARIQKLEQQVTGVSQRTDTTLEQQFYAALGGLVPDWEKINADERWLQWLAEIDPIYGVPRQAALDAAHKALDPKRVANVFNAFKSQFQPKAADSLSAQVAPSGAASSAPVAAPAKQLLSSRFVENFYNDVARGRYVGREAEMQRLEAEINAAAAEGRIR
jgi:hypothetical protein